jgi:hypothetical protein
MEIGEARDLCICPDCPTYVACGEPLAFCLYVEGHSTCITAERGCICPECPVYASKDLQYDFYCTRGNEKVQARV